MRARLLPVCVLTLVLSLPLFAQETGGSITGIVTDATGAVIPNANITVTNTETGVVVRTLKSSQDGTFSALRLPIGRYSLTTEVEGFQKSVVSNLELNVAEVLRVDPKLTPGSRSESVEITADALQVQTEEASSGTVITGAQIRELSINNRNYEQLVSLMPGVSYGGGDQLYIGTTNPSGQTNTVPFSINGQRPSANSWSVDGADNVDRGSNLTLLTYPSVDAIAEFKVVRNVYSAEYGRNAAGQVNVVTKSGTKDFHGGAYWFVRNDIFNANSFVNNARNIARPPLRYNNFGYTIGGPVIIPGLYNPGEKKTFFFFSHEFRRQSVPGNFTAIVPTAAEKAGTFTRTVCVAPNTYGTTCPAGSTGTTVASINPIAQQYIQAIWSQVPGPTNPATHEFFGTRQSIFNHRQELARVDHFFSPRWNVMFRFLNDTIPTQEPGGLFTNAVLPNVANTKTNSPGRSYIAKSVNTFGSDFLMEVGYAKSYGAIISDPTGLLATAFGTITTPLPFAPTLNRIPSVTFTNGASSITGFGPYDNFNRNHNAWANLSKILGRHTLKFGATYHHYQKNENAAGNNAGTFNFNANGAVTTGLTGTALADARFQQAWANFLVGDVNQFTQTSLDLRPDIQTNQFEWYVHDDWKVLNNLTLNLGLRHSLFRQPHDENNLLTTFDPTLFNPSNAPAVSATTGNITSAAGTFDVLNGISVNRQTSPHGSKVAPEKNTLFAPRIGIAWDPWGRGKTAIRAGYGISYDMPLVGILEQNIFTNRPFLQNVSISNTRFENATAASPTVSASPTNIRGTQWTGDFPYVQSYSLDVQQEFPGNTIFAIGYYGNKGTNLLGIADINQPLPGQLAICNGVPVVTGATCGATTVANSPHINAVRPYRGYGPINVVIPIFTSNYNSMQTSLQKRFSGSSQISVSYTWSKGLTTAQTDRSSAPQNVYNIRADYGPSQLDRRHLFNTNFVWELPWFKNRGGVVGHVLGGWQTTGILYMYSGLPLTVITSGVDPAGQGYNIATSSVSGRPDLIGNPNGPRGTHFLASGGPTWLNTAAFVPVCPSTTPASLCANPRPGNSPRGVAYGPGFIRQDLSLFKNFTITERMKLQFRTEAFNLFNHTNPNGVDVNQTSATFGRITTYRDPREMQFGLKLNF